MNYYFVTQLFALNVTPLIFLGNFYLVFVILTHSINMLLESSRSQLSHFSTGHSSHGPQALPGAPPESPERHVDDDDDGGGDQAEHHAQVAAGLVARVAALGRVTRVRRALHL